MRGSGPSSTWCSISIAAAAAAIEGTAGWMDPSTRPLADSSQSRREAGDPGTDGVVAHGVDDLGPDRRHLSRAAPAGPEPERAVLRNSWIDARHAHPRARYAHGRRVGRGRFRAREADVDPHPQALGRARTAMALAAVRVEVPETGARHAIARDVRLLHEI